MAEGGLPDLATQKKIIEEYLSANLKIGEFWYLIDIRWFKQWKKYVGFDQWDSYNIGDQSVHPGPIDNSSLFKSDTNIMREHLVDNLDYVLLPEEAYKLLVSWYGQACGQNHIARKVIEQGTFVKQCKVEVYLMELKLCENSDTTTVVTQSFSRADTVATIEQEMRQLFSIPEEKEVRLWNRYTSNTFELLSKMDSTVQDAGLYQGQVIVIEVKNEDGTWPRQSRRGAGYCGASASFSSDSNNQGTSTSSSSFNTVNSYHDGYEKNFSNKPGLCGLSNLGNTCFMNSALQCMSNVSLLTEYMLSGQWENELNKDNPLGMRGEIAVSYSELIRDMWSGQRSYTVPKNFKIAVGRFAPQFSGFQQQDSQELMAFLLDGLHEDLNRIRKKPYIELTDFEGRPDKVVAKEAWDNYKKRNDSIIVDIFHGLLKSTVQCPDCGKISVTFDPFCYLSLPLLVKRERLIEVIFVPLSVEKKPLQIKLTVPKSGSIRDLCVALSDQTNVYPDKLVVTDVYNHRFHKVFAMDESVNHILERDDIFIYEIPVSDANDKNILILPVYFRDKSYSNMQKTDPNSAYSQTLFSYPLLLAVPRHSCTYDRLYQLLLQKISRYVRIPDDLENWQEQFLDNEDDDENSSSENINCSSVGASNGNVNVSSKGGEASNGHDSVLQMDTEKCDGENLNVTNNKDDSEAVASCSSCAHTSHKKRIFTLKASNNFGRDDADTVLVDDGRPLRMTNRTYIVVEWSKAAKDRFFDEKAAEDFEEHESVKLEYSQDRRVIQLDDCLKQFMKEERLSEMDPWYCPMCKQHKQASKKFDLWSLPNVLIIHLKRFSFNRYWRDKIDVLVEFPLQGLDLRKYVINDEASECDVYDLIAVTNHYGGLGGGHYTAYAKNKDDGNWYHFDDATVTSSSEDSVVTKAAYVLVYQRRTLSQIKKLQQSASTYRTSLNNANNSFTSNTLTSIKLELSVPNGAGAASEDDDLESI